MTAVSNMRSQMRRHACRGILVVAAALGACAESTTSTPFDGSAAPWARASRHLFLGADSPPPPKLSTDACVVVSQDDGNDCDDDDGAPGSEFPMCAYCTDCVDYCPRVPRAPPPPPAGTPSGTGSPDAKYPNGQLGTDGADYGPGQPLPPPAASPAPLRAGTGIRTKTCFYDAECDDGGSGSEFPMCAYGNDYVDCDGRTASPPPPPYSPGMVCTNNCLNAGGSSCSDGGGPGSECLFCAARAVLSFKSAIMGTKRALASTHRAGMGTLRVVMGNMRVLVSGPNAVMGIVRAVVGIICTVVGRIRAAVASPSPAGTIRVVMGNQRAFVSSPSAVMGTMRVVEGIARAVTSITSAVLGIKLRAVMGNMRAVVSTSRAVVSAARAVVGTNIRAVVSIPRAVALSMPPPETPPCRSDLDLMMAPDLAQVLDVVRAVHVQPWQVLVQPWQLGASLDDREGVEVDADRLGARRPLDAACAAQDARCGGERSKEGLLVLRFDVLDKGCPVDLTKPLTHAALVPDPGFGPACLTVGPPSCQRMASAGFSVESAHGLDGHSILNPRQLVCWGCLLMTSLMAWHRRFVKSPCCRPHRPREKQGVHGALTLLAWCTMLPCTETSDVPGLNRGLQLAVPSHRRELQTAVSDSAGLTSALANTAVSRIVLASGTYNLIAELNITRSVILEAAVAGSVILNAQASPPSWRRVVNINPGSSGVVQLIGLNITGGNTGGNLCFETCMYASDGDCDDSGPGAEFAECTYGTDCTDCGTRSGAVGVRAHVKNFPSP